jgi:uncharacterized protein (TIGR02147 family)
MEKATTASSPELLAYDNYRSFLKDWYQYSRAQDAKISFRYLSRRSGLKSPNYWKLIMSGERSLSVEMIPRFAETLKLQDSYKLYFHHLVLMNQADALKEKSLHAQRIVELRKKLLPLSVGKISDPLYYQHWYNPVLRELAPLMGTDCSPQKIQNLLLKKIPLQEIQDSLDFLCAAGFLKQQDDQSYQQRESLLSTGDRASHILAYRCLQKLHSLGVEALDQIPEHDREYGALTLSLGSEQYDELKKLVRKFRKDALEIASQNNDKNTARVVQVNVQVFPSTQYKAGTSL